MRIKKNLSIILMILILIFSNKIVKVNATENDEEMYYNLSASALAASDLSSIVNFINEKASNGFITNLYSTVDQAKFEQLVYNVGNKVTNVEEIELYNKYVFVNVDRKSEKEFKELPILQRQTIATGELLKVTMDQAKNLYREKTGQVITDSTVISRLAGTKFVYIKEKEAFYTDSVTSNYIAVKGIEGLLTDDGYYKVQITSRDAEDGELSRMFYDGDKEIKSTIVTLKKQGSAYIFISNENGNTVSLLADNGIYTGYDELNINDLDYDFTVDYLAQYNLSFESNATNEVSNSVIVKPKSTTPTAIIVSTVTVGIIGILAMTVFILNKKLKPKKFIDDDEDYDNYDYSKRSDINVMDSYNEEDFDEMEREIEEKEIINNPVDEEIAEREIELRADIRAGKIPQNKSRKTPSTKTTSTTKKSTSKKENTKQTTTTTKRKKKLVKKKKK